MKKSLVLFLCLVLVSTAFLAGCSPKAEDTTPVVETPPASTEDPAPTEPVAEEPSGTLVVGITEASGNFNPLYYSSAYDGYVVDMVFEGLISRNFEGEYEGVVADSWEYSED
ncbi:MAG: hypothetical protein SCL54_15455, partial [Bacillota bacterium]|nr:hypothetical protein [Bacillota bacterium]